MNDFTEVFSLLLTGLVILLLFLMVEESVNGFEKEHKLMLVKHELLVKALNNSRVLTRDELKNAYFINLETNETIGGLNNSITSSLPYLEYDEFFTIGRVIQGE